MAGVESGIHSGSRVAHVMEFAIAKPALAKRVSDVHRCRGVFCRAVHSASALVVPLRQTIKLFHTGFAAFPVLAEIRAGRESRLHVGGTGIFAAFGHTAGAQVLLCHLLERAAAHGPHALAADGRPASPRFGPAGRRRGSPPSSGSRPTYLSCLISCGLSITRAFFTT